MGHFEVCVHIQSCGLSLPQPFYSPSRMKDLPKCLSVSQFVTEIGHVGSKWPIFKRYIFLGHFGVRLVLIIVMTKFWNRSKDIGVRAFNRKTSIWRMDIFASKLATRIISSTHFKKLCCIPILSKLFARRKFRVHGQLWWRLYDFESYYQKNLLGQGQPTRSQTQVSWDFVSK